MSAGFGFSVGDFIAALKIVSDVIDALRESGNSTVESRLLLRQLYELETALIHVRRLELDEAQADQLHALRRAALQCRTTIDEFMKKIQKYQPHLHSGSISTSSLIKQSWYKVKWALCRKEDIEKFKADLIGHTEAINILMNAISIQQMTLQSRTRDDQHFSLKGIIKECYTNTMQKLSAISDTVTSSLSHSKRLLEMTAQTAQMDCKIFGAILDVQDLVRRTVAPQVLRAQPVYFIDALGIPSPFHLEFIRSRSAFLAVLRSNMNGNDMAVERIDRGDFAISDVTTKRDIDLSRPWDMCFRPGQKADMSMIMTAQGMSVSSCPSCKAECPADHDSDIVCAICGLTFRRLTELKESEPTNVDLMSNPQSSPASHVQIGSHVLMGPEIPTKKRKRNDDIAQELAIYRRVRLWQPSKVEHPFTLNLANILSQLTSSKSNTDNREKSSQTKEPVDFNEALKFVERVKTRYKQKPEIYKQFLHIIQTYQKESKPIPEVVDFIATLLHASSDLMEAFRTYIPNTAARVLQRDAAKDIISNPDGVKPPESLPSTDELSVDSPLSTAHNNDSERDVRVVNFICDICDREIESSTSWYRCASGNCANPQDSYDVCSSCYTSDYRCPGCNSGDCAGMLLISYAGP